MVTGFTGIWSLHFSILLINTPTTVLIYDVNQNEIRRCDNGRMARADLKLEDAESAFARTASQRAGNRRLTNLSFEEKREMSAGQKAAQRAIENL